MDIKKIERVSVLSKKVMNSRATVPELNEYRSLLKKWTNRIDGPDTKTRPQKKLGMNKR